jgi:hypothetical protein
MTYSGKGVYHCDECPDHIETGEDDFDSRRAALQMAGWRTFKGPDGLWANTCPACKEAWAKTRKGTR